MVRSEALLAWVVLLPLFGAVASYCLGRWRSVLSGWIALSAVVVSFVLALCAVYLLPDRTVTIVRLFAWIDLGGLSIDFALRLDALSGVMVLVVTGVGSVIHLYSIGYMAHDPARPRFFAYLNLFIFAMLLLVLGANLLVLFIGWEGVGLCSYLLIGFWFKNRDYAAAGRKAFVVNRLGDAGFLIGLFLIAAVFGTVDFDKLALAAAAMGSDYELLFTIVTMALFVGAAGKSAQLPLFVWLPDAMAGPTPVSALIHAATMVTAGVYMIARLHFLFALAPLTLALVVMIAALTAFIAATSAVFQNDIKKVLAYSTVSQLGFMFMALGAGVYSAAIFHLVTHAFFKACLFLAAGSVIHGAGAEQDMRYLGGLRRSMPITFGAFAVSSVAIAGIWPFAGYFSKHAILVALARPESALPGWMAGAVLVIAMITAVLTAIYMGRVVMLTFFGSYRGEVRVHESPAIMWVPLMLLACGAVTAGLLLCDSLPHYLSAVLPLGAAGQREGVLAGIGHSWPGILGLILAWLFYGPARKRLAAGSLEPLGSFFSQAWQIDRSYRNGIVAPLYAFSCWLCNVVEHRLIDGAVNGVAVAVRRVGQGTRVLQSGQIGDYTLAMLWAVALLLLAGVLL